MPLSSTQKRQVAAFVSETGVNDKVAQQFLKASNYSLSDAMKAHSREKRKQLEQLFDSLKLPGETDTLGEESIQNYFKNFGADLADPSCFILVTIIFKILRTTNIYAVTRNDFVDGWALPQIGNGKDMMFKVESTIADQKQYLSQLVAKLPGNKRLFEDVYKYAFELGKDSGAKELGYDVAVGTWRMVFQPPGWEWITVSGTNFLEEWLQYLEEKWPRSQQKVEGKLVKVPKSISKDVWDQTLRFAFHTLDDETLSFWNEYDAWNSNVDEFVEWYKAKSAMDVDR